MLVIVKVHLVCLMNAECCQVLLTLGPSQLTWVMNPSVVLLSPQADTHFTIPQRVEGQVDIGTAIRSATSLALFRKTLKTELFTRSYTD